MAGDLTFHIPQEAEPTKVLPLLEAMFFEGKRFTTVKALLEFADERGLGNRTEIQLFARICGLLEHNEGIQLSDNAKALVQLKSDVQADLVHFLLYTGWVPDDPSTKTRLWSYRQVVDSLWHMAPINVVDVTDVLVTEIVNRTDQVFGDLQEFEGGVSFSDKSVRGARKWLEGLNPQVIDKDDNFSNRYFCPSELMLLASGWVARTTGGEIGIDFLLTPERREAICRLCLIDTSALDRVIDWMLPIYPEFVQSGTSAGAYGRFVRFLKWPELGSLAPKS